MKRAACMFLTLVLMLSAISGPVQAATFSVTCHPGEAIKVIFTLSEDGEQPEGVMGRLQYDTDVFTVIPSQYLIGTDGINILTATPVPTPTPAPTQTKQIKVGGYVTFGRYPQTAKGTDNTPIEWQVLEVKGNQALLLSRYGLDVKQYHTTFTTISWEKCTLRTWLNNAFLNKAFSENEQQEILTTNVDNSMSQGYSGWHSTNGGKDTQNTQDKVFLLSYKEANKYLGVSAISRSVTMRVIPTAYAINKGAFVSIIEGGPGWWWLRSW